MAQNNYDGLDNGVLPWHRLWDSPVSLIDKQAKEQYGVVAQQGRPHGIRSPSSAEMNSPAVARTSQRTRSQSNWAHSGPMQAIFLGPKKKSCGTGVFIPRGQGADPQINTKPAFSPVLLPSRVVQALNLNVHELGQNIKPHQAVQNKSNIKNKDEKLEKEEDVSIPLEILLPEEWTY